MCSKIFDVEKALKFICVIRESNPGHLVGNEVS